MGTDVKLAGALEAYSLPQFTNSTSDMGIYGSLTFFLAFSW